MDDKQITEAITNFWEQSEGEFNGITSKGEALIKNRSALKITVVAQSENVIASVHGKDQLRRVITLLYGEEASRHLPKILQGLSDHPDSSTLYILPAR